MDVVLSGPITRADIADLCRSARLVLGGNDAELVVCDLGAVVDPDAVTVEAVARLQLTARRLGRRLRFRHACRELHQLVALMGLGGVLPLGGGSWLESGRKAEQREQCRCVEEEGDP